MANLSDLIKQNLEDKEQELKSRFKDVAESAGWESHLAESIQFTPTGIKIAEEFKAEIEDTEFGDGFSQPPRSALRKFKPTYKDYLTEAVEKSVLDFLSSEASEVFKK